MSVKHEVVFAAALALLVAPAASAEKLSKESRKWLEEEAAPIIAPSEEKFFKDMKEADRLEFQKIFWSRRDPSNDTPRPENDFKAEYLKKKSEADQKFRAPGRAGSTTDCGRTYILLGEPDQKQQGTRGEGALGTRSPESWIYKDKPSMPVRIKGGQLQVEFDEVCQFAEGSTFRQQLTRIAEGKILRPGLDFRAGKDGRLVKLVDLLPKPTLAQLLLKEPRQDFTAAAAVQFLKTSDGGTALVGVIQGKAEGLTTIKLPSAAVDVTTQKQSESTTRVTVKDVPQQAVKVTIAAQAIDESGRLGTNYEQATIAPVAADGTFSASYRLGLKPGKYSLRVAALDEATKKGSVVEKPADVPDLNTGELSAASLIAVREIEESVQNSDPTHPFSAYLLGNARLVPFSALPLSKSDALNIFYQYYDAKVDVATGKASVVATLQIVRRQRAPQCLVSVEDFDEISAGMSYEGVVGVIGSVGEKRSETTLPGLVGEIHQWKNSDGSSLLVSFQNGRLVNKTQTQLPNGCKSKGDRPVARAADAPFELQVGGTVVGPVPLEKYEPGAYTVKLKVVDNLAKKELTRELTFEIR